MKTTIETVTFKIPTPTIFCCFGCASKRRDISNGNSYPVIKREKTDKMECAGGERITIKTDCKKEFGFSVLYF